MSSVDFFFHHPMWMWSQPMDPADLPQPRTFRLDPNGFLQFRERVPAPRSAPRWGRGVVRAPGQLGSSGSRAPFDRQAVRLGSGRSRFESKSSSFDLDWR